MAGELITDDWQAEFDGYRFDNMVELDGIEGLPDVRISDLPRGRQHGSLAGPQYAGERVVTMVVEVAADDFRTEVDALNAATQPDGPERELVFRAGHGTARMVWARVRRRSLPSDQRFAFGLGVATIQFVATDPRIYGTVPSSASTTPGTTIGGLGFPHAFPHGFGTTTAGTLETTNDGSTGAPWTATLTGPLSSPAIRLMDLDGELAFSGFSLAAGDTLTLDSLNRTVLLNGTASRYGALTVRDWFEIPPGGATIGFSASSGGGSLSMDWRSTWM